MDYIYATEQPRIISWALPRHISDVFKREFISIPNLTYEVAESFNELPHIQKMVTKQYNKTCRSLLPYMYCKRFYSGTIRFFMLCYDKRKVKHREINAYRKDCFD